jgi:hypothetical protein
MKCIESTQEELDTGLHAIGLFYDLSKEYAVINHNTRTLLDKLYSYGTRCKSYLQD